ncbi:type II toxin-antitoxin system HicA family toxin [Lactobacillus sp. ESL0228]|uniref:type II toxin-antitoxin system HicA family toxin n=1 Tax=Lactobacillus sp. ESL0228 TaxID=2069352 RepID=UPI000EFC8267|nr:type II toxin-antitoxin system HicA family toxin [Lactobacillus sp. ESL0228]RMC48913.1 type II toxin-antitoxin system HicA family toxin [Lactobacillus sp. ESL0228]
MPMKPREIVKLLKSNGFKEKSQRGSHLKLYNPNTNVTVFVPIHAKELKKGLEQAIFREAGLK